MPPFDFYWLSALCAFAAGDGGGGADNGTTDKTLLEQIAEQVDEPTAPPTAEQLEASLDKLNKRTAHNAAPDPLADAARASGQAAQPADAPAVADATAESGDALEAETGEEKRIVSMERFRGLSKKYSALEKEHETAKQQLADALAQLATERKRAADERLNYLRTAYENSEDVIASMLKGETLEDVEKSLAEAKEAATTARAWLANRTTAPLNHPNGNGNGARKPRNGSGKKAFNEEDYANALAALDGRAN